MRLTLFQLYGLRKVECWDELEKMWKNAPVAQVQVLSETSTFLQELRKITKNLLGIAGLRAKIQAWGLPSTKQECSVFANVRGRFVVSQDN
jgi:hypothetical protein